jgi:hypothetical protein
MSRWTATRIAAHMTSLFRDARLILVSNQAPYSHRWQGPAPPAHRADHPSVPGTAVGNVGWQRRGPAQASRIQWVT